jgi:hypothetical protein
VNDELEVGSPAEVPRQLTSRSSVTIIGVDQEQGAALRLDGTEPVIELLADVAGVADVVGEVVAQVDGDWRQGRGRCREWRAATATRTAARTVRAAARVSPRSSARSTGP